MKFDKVLCQQSLALLSVFVNSLMYGCAGSWVANAMIFLTELNEDPRLPSATEAECGMMAQLFEAGRLIFAIPGGVLTEKFGRKKILIVVVGVNFVAWVILSVSTSLVFIYLSRFMMGVAGALLYVSAYTMIGELASPHYRGTLTSVNEVANMFGQLFESIVTVIFNSYIYLTDLTTIMASFFFPTIWWLIESPHHFTNIAKYKSARNSLKILRPGHTDEEIDDEYEVLKHSIDIEKSNKNKVNWFNFFKNKSIRKPLLCAILLNIFAVSCGGPVMSIYIGVMLPPISSSVPTTYYPLISCVIQFVASIWSTFVIDKFPRRMLYLLSALVSIAMQSFSAFAYVLYDRNQSKLWMWCFILNNFLYMFVDRGLISTVNCTVRSEIFPHNMKGIGNALCIISQAVSLIFCYNIYEIVRRYGLEYSYLVFAFDSCILATIVYLLLPEMRGKSLAQVQYDLKMEAEEKEAFAPNKNTGNS